MPIRNLIIINYPSKKLLQEQSTQQISYIFFEDIFSFFCFFSNKNYTFITSSALAFTSASTLADRVFVNSSIFFSKDKLF